MTDHPHRMTRDTFAAATWLVRRAPSRVWLTDYRVRLTGLHVPVTIARDSSAGSWYSTATCVVPLPRRGVREARCCVTRQSGASRAQVFVSTGQPSVSG
jgi:hypothetical protein